MNSVPLNAGKAAVIAALLLTHAMSVGHLWAQDGAAPQVAVTAATPGAPVTTGDLVAPIALYPDQLLGQVLTISTTPQEVLDLGNWLIENDTLSGGKAQDAAKAAGFSTSAQYLAMFPQVVDNMCQQIDWTTQLGDAYTDNAKGVMAAIQTKRQEAIKAGTLKTSSQLTVNTKKADNGTSYIEIVPTDPKVIYVPVYNPVNVYVTNPTPAPAPAAAPAPATTTTVVVQQGVSSGTAVGIALLSFGVGMAVGASINNSYYPYPMWGYGMYYGGRPYYPPPYRPPYYPGYHPAYGYHPPASYHWNQVNRQTNITINNNNYYNKINNNSNNRTRNSNNANRPGQVGGGNRAGANGRPSEYKGARPSTNDRPGGGTANANRPGAGGAATARPGAGGAANRPGAGGGGTARPAPGAAGAATRPAGSADRGYGGGAGNAAASRPSAPQSRPAAPQQQNRGGGAFGSAGGGSGSSARAASSRGHASAGAARGGGGGGGGRRR